MLNPSNVLGDGGAFRAIFFEEAQEHLVATEAALLRLNPAADSAEDMNAIFRAVHSIKGSAAMLGYEDVAQLTHAMENLLDLLRKGARRIESADVDAMLKASDAVKSQVASHRLGQTQSAPETAEAEGLLKQRVLHSDGNGAVSRLRHFSVRLGPLAEPIDAGELDTMLGGLAAMGSVANQAIDNTVGGSVAFDVALDGTEVDLKSVLSLVVPATQVVVDWCEPASTPAQDSGVSGAIPASAAADRGAVAADAGDELFVDPAQFKRRHRRVVRARAVLEESSSDEASEVAAQRPAAGSQAPAATPADGNRPAPAARPEAGSIRIPVDKIDMLVNLVGELVITESMLSREFAVDQLSAANRGRKGLTELARHTRNLQEAVLSIRMVPISSVFARFPRLVRELAQRLGKQVTVVTSGESTELDRALIERISDPLTHLVRNAIDHGLETAEARVAAGKSPMGTLSLSAKQMGGMVIIEVCDDGRGLDRSRILAKAIEAGVDVSADAPDEDVWRLVFEAGLSTAENVTDLSGRGVGMDVVRRNIQLMGGTVELQSQPGKGVKVTVSVPLTLAIVEAMTVCVDGSLYVLPLTSVVETRIVMPGDLRVLPGGAHTLRVRGEYLPVLHLAGTSPPREGDPQHERIAVIVESDGLLAALLVDEMPGQQQVVVKSVEANFKKVPGVSGASIMSDGSVAVILDVGYLIHSLVRSKHRPAPAGALA